MPIRFKFNPEKSISAIAYLLERIGPMEKVALVKLLYIGDRDHFIRFGYPITGSRLVAMDKGPLPSECLSLIDGKMNASEFSRHLSLEKKRVEIRQPVEVSKLDDTEKATLDDVIARFGSAPTWDLVEHTHKFAEYVEVYVRGTSTQITFENLLAHYGGDCKFRHGKPVLSRETQAKMVSPFPVGSDSDL